jgi:hypothetical protein
VDHDDRRRVQNFWSGYQIAAATGGTYDWSQTADGTGSLGILACSLIRPSGWAAELRSVIEPWGTH